MASKSKKKVNIGFRTFKIAVVLVVTAYLGYTFISQQIQINDLNNNISKLDNQIATEKIRKQELEQKKKQINTPEYIEKIARNELGLVAPDETVFMEAPKNKN